MLLFHTPAGSFVAPPENVTVYSGEMARFTCKVTESGQWGLYWHITEEQLEPGRLPDSYQARNWDPEEIDDLSTTTIALEIIGISETNHTSVECSAYYPNAHIKTIRSDRVYLRVQGKY